MSLFRQIGRNAPRLFKQASRGADVFGRQVVNTTRQISSGLDKASRIVNDVEKVTDSIPIAKQAVRTVGDVLNTASKANKAVSSAGTGLRQASAGDIKGAISSFQSAAQDAGGAVASAGDVFV